MITGTLTDDLIEAYESYEHERMACMQEAFDAYAGNHPPSLSVTADAPNDNVIINYSRLIVKAGVQALVGKEPNFVFDPTDENPKGDDTAQAIWQAWVTQQRTFLLSLQKIATNGGKAGTAYYKLSMSTGTPSLRVLDPRHVTAFWDPEHVDDVWAYLVRWTQIDLNGKEMSRRQIVERTTEQSWTIRDQQSPKNTHGAWRAVRPDVTWLYPWPPMGHCQNLPEPSECYGEPDLPEDVISLNYNLNRVASNTNKIIRLHAHPKLIGFGMSVDDLDVAPDEMVTINNPESRVDTIAPVSDIQASLTFAGQLREGLHEVTRTPEVATGKMENVGQLSGVALQILYGPIVSQTEQKQLTYGPMLEEMARRVLELLGTTVTDSRIGFQNVEPVDRKEELEGAVLAQSLGASKQTTLEEVGYDAEKELALSEDENASSLAAAQQAMARGDVPNFTDPLNASQTNAEYDAQGG